MYFLQFWEQKNAKNSVADEPSGSQTNFSL